MSERIKRAKRMNRIMTAVFYAVAVFFLILLAAFAGKVIIGGLIGAKPEMFGFDRQGCIGNQLFNTVYLVLVALVCSGSVPVGVFAGIYLAIYAKQGILTRFLRICIETLSSLPSIVVGLFGYLVFLVFMGMGKSLLAGALSVSILTLPLLGQRAAGRIFSGQPGTGSYEVAVCLPCDPPGVHPQDHDRGCPGGRAGLRRGGCPSVHDRFGEHAAVGQLGLHVAHKPAQSAAAGGDTVHADLESADQRPGPRACGSGFGSPSPARAGL